MQPALLPTITAICTGAGLTPLKSTEDIQNEIPEMLRESPIPYSEEWAIHDLEGFEGAEIAEYSGIETVVKLAGFGSEHGELGGKLLAHFLRRSG